MSKAFGFNTLAEVKKANKDNGMLFFSPGSMKFFRSRMESTLLKGGYFITSEQFEDDEPRTFAVRRVEDTLGSIETIETRLTSKDEAKKLIASL